MDFLKRINNINGDISSVNKLTLRSKFVYLLFNFFRGLSGQFCIPKNRYRKWIPKNIALKKKKEAGIADTPSRVYIDLFLDNFFNNRSIPKKNLKMLDVGCGSGYVRKFLKRTDFLKKYIGLDIKKRNNFDLFSENNYPSYFYEGNIEDFDIEEKFDIIFSSTFLEHVKDDLSVLKKMDMFAKMDALQIHLVPSFWTLFLYFWHGYRQYTPRRIENIFPTDKKEIYCLGGLFSFFLHLFFITIPEKIFKTSYLRKTSGFLFFRNKAIYLDKFLPLFPTIYVIVIESK